MSLVDHPSTQPSLDISPIWTSIITAEVKELPLCPVQIMCESCVLCWYRAENCLPSDDFYSDSTLILTTVAVNQCVDIDARSHGCGVFFFFLCF
jgi:hypothetical protein